MKTLRVNGRYLEWDDGTPFYYLGDTAWELIHRLNREEVAEYMRTRARQGFTAIQSVALAELDGFSAPNAYGRYPLLTDERGLPDPASPDVSGEYSYWAHLDYVVETAAENGLFLALLPTWGDKFCPLWGKGPMIFTTENARAYGKWIGARYRDHWNIIWMLGGDRPLDEATRPIIDQMAAGILTSDTGHLITFHPPGGHNSTEFVGDADYIDLHTAQTGHDTAKCYESDAELLRMAQASDKPYMDSEPRYESHPACFNAKLGYLWGAAEVRQNAYWNLMAGACGHTYGNHNIWSMNTEPSDYFPCHWRDALTHPGAEQMRFVKQLRLRGDFRSLRLAPELLAANEEGNGRLTAARGKGYGYVYVPLGTPFTADLGALATGGVLRAFWFDPRTGEEALFGVYPARGRSLFVPPSSGQGQDWVLILESVE